MGRNWPCSGRMAENGRRRLELGQVSRASPARRCRVAGHSAATTEKRAESRAVRSGAMRWARSTPSKVAPRRAIAARERSLRASVCRQTRSTSQCSNAKVSSSVLASVLTPVRMVERASQVWPISQASGAARPWRGWAAGQAQRSRPASSRPRGRPRAARSRTAGRCRHVARRARSRHSARPRLRCRGQRSIDRPSGRRRRPPARRYGARRAVRGEPDGLRARCRP